MANKGKDTTTTTTVGPDISQLRNPIQISGKPIEQVLKGIHYGSPELRCLLWDECDLIFECKVCRALFRDVPNFISHKRIYCTKSSLEDRHVTIASLPEEKVVVIQPQAPEETEVSQTMPTTQKPPRPTLDETIKRIQSGELGKSQEYKVYTEAAEKLQRQKETMKIATIRTTPIPTNKNAVFIEVNTTSVNIHERQQCANSVTALASDPNHSDTQGTARNKKASDRASVATTVSSPRHLRKPARQEKHTTEPQKLLLEQLKEIQHKVKQKSSQVNEDRVAGQKSATQENAYSRNKNRSGIQDNDENANSGESSENGVDTKDNSQQKDSGDLSNLARQNFLSLLAKEEAKGSSEKKEEQLKGNVVIRRRKNMKVWQNISKQSATTMAKELVKSSSRDSKKMKNSLTCAKCSSIFSSRKSLGFHMKIHHSPKRTFYQCPYCPSNFYYFFGITRHLFNNHSKTAEEIDEMRAQLRDQAVIRPAPPPKQKKDMFEMQSSRRRGARAQMEEVANAADSKDKLNDIFSVPHGKSIKILDESNHCVETQLSRQKKKISADFIEGETIILDDSGDSADAASLDVRHKAKTDETFKREGENEASTSKSRSFNSTKTVGVASLLISKDKEEFNKNCPQCKKPFSRPRIYENHLKTCRLGKSPSKIVTDKPGTPTKFQVNSPAAIQDEEADTKLLALKDKLLSSTFGITGVTLQTEDLIDPKAMALKEKLIRTTFGLTRVADTKSVEGKNKVIDVLNDKVASEKTPLSELNSTRRSNSSDREVSRLSREMKSDIEKDKRDSSTESTQSSVEGRPARSRRAVPSKYAVIVTPVQKSPQKADVTEKVEPKGSVKISPENASQLSKLQRKSETGETVEPGIFPLPKLQKRPDIDLKSIADPKPSIQNLIQMPKLQKKPDLKSPTSTPDTLSPKDNTTSIRDSISPKDNTTPSIETRLQTSKDSYHYMLMKVVNKNNLQSMLSQANPVVRKSPLKNEPKRLQGRPQKTYFAPRIPSGSGNPPSGAEPVLSLNVLPARRLSSSPQKYNMSTSTHRRTLSSVISSRTTFKDIPALRAALTSSRGLPAERSDNIKESGLEGDKRNEPETDNKIATNRNVDEVSVKSIPSLSVKKELMLESQEKSQLASQHVVKCDESDSENSKASDKFVSKGAKTSPNLPVSALSERPKRKRKVPNRNLDAQDMLSKIHNRKPAVPRKKAKLSNVKSGKSAGDKHTKRNQPSDDESSSDREDEMKDVSAKSSSRTARGAKKRATASNSNNNNDCSDVGDDEEIEEETVKGKGRVVSNRIYVLNESNSKVQKLKCYDQTRVTKYINPDNTSCLQCGEVCTSISNLRRHVIRQHLKWSRFKCKLCKFESYDRSECTTHLFRTHKKIAAHNFSSRRSLNALIIDLVKEGLHARSLKKNRTLKGKQQSENEGNIYTRPNVRKLPRLPERAAAAAALLGARTSHLPTPVTDNSSVSKQSSKSKSPNSSSSSSPTKSWFKVSPSGKLRKVVPISAAARNSEGNSNTDSPKNPSQGVKKESWFKVLPSGRLKKVLPFNISTRNSPRNFDTSPYRQGLLTKGNGEEQSKHTRKGKTTKANTSLTAIESSKKVSDGSSSNSVEFDNSHTTEDVGSHEKLHSSKDEHSKKMEKHTKGSDLHDPGKNESGGETAQPTFLRSQPNSGESTVTPPPPQKTSVKYIITTTDGLQRFVEKSPKTQVVASNPNHKVREITTENSPALSDQLAKSLMKLKKLGDSMNTSTKGPPTSSATTQVGSSSNTVTLSSAVATSTTSTPVTFVGKTETHPGKPQGSGMSVSIPLSLPSGSTPSSFVLTRGASGKIIVYTHSAEDKQATPTSTSLPLKSILPSSLTTSKITVKSKDTGNKSGANVNSDDDSLPSGTFVIQQHFL